VQSELLYHSEEVAFYRGQEWEKQRINDSFYKLLGHQNKIMNLRLYMGLFDGMLVKYGAVMAGYGIMGIPVFGSGSANYLSSVGDNKSKITRDYVRNSSLLINLSKSIGKLIVSYKEIQ
jgi:ATP-binding cassette subfamily D (ALD) protein 3